MKIKSIKKKENPLLKRTELEILIDHLNEPTPSRQKLIDYLAANLGADKNLLVIRKIATSYGPLSKIFAVLYNDENALKETELKHILKRQMKGEKSAEEKA